MRAETYTVLSLIVISKWMEVELWKKLRGKGGIKVFL